MLLRPVHDLVLGLPGKPGTDLSHVLRGLPVDQWHAEAVEAHLALLKLIDVEVAMVSCAVGPLGDADVKALALLNYLAETIARAADSVSIRSTRTALRPAVARCIR